MGVKSVSKGFQATLQASLSSAKWLQLQQQPQQQKQQTQLQGLLELA